jgi:hypothetical protein
MASVVTKQRGRVLVVDYLSAGMADYFRADPITIVLTRDNFFAHGPRDPLAIKHTDIAP